MTMSPCRMFDELPEITRDEVRFSRGYLLANPSHWFTGLAAQWTPLLHVLSADIKFISASTRLGLPDNLMRIAEIEIDEEAAVLGMDDHSRTMLASFIDSNLPHASADVYLEYLERRFCSTLKSTWGGEGSLSVLYQGVLDAGFPPIIGTVQLRFQLQDESFAIWVGLGPKMTERFDLHARRELSVSGTEDYGDAVREISVELAELWVPPAMLIDYMRSGTVIDLEREPNRSVSIRLEGKPWALGEICSSEGNLVVRIESLQTEQDHFVEGSTRLSVVLGRTLLDLTSLREHSQEGVILLLDTLLLDSEIPRIAEIVIGSETVATAEIGEMDGHLAVEIQGIK